MVALSYLSVYFDERFDTNTHIHSYMNKKRDIEALLHLGLSQTEASVYRCALGLGPTTPLSIARSCGVKRTSVYSILERLKQLGLVSIQTKGFKKFYVAESPSKLTALIDEKQNVLNTLTSDLLKVYKKGSDQTEIKHYQGLKAVKSLYGDILRELSMNEEYLVIEDLSKWYDLDKNYFEKFIEKRAQKGIKAKFLFQDSKEAREHQKYSKNYGVEDKILPRKINLDTSLIITPREVIIHDLGEISEAILIRNKGVINMCRAIFDLIWELA